MINDKLNPYFDEMRNKRFLFSTEDAAAVIVNNQFVIRKFAKLKIVIMMSVFLLAIVVLVPDYLTKNTALKSLLFSTNVGHSKQSTHNESTGTIPENAKPGYNNFIPHKSNILFQKDTLQTIANQNTANVYQPGSNNFFSMLPYSLLISNTSVDFQIPEMSEWGVSNGAQSCSSEEDKVNSNIDLRKYGGERLDSIKLNICSDEEYAKLGIHKTSAGIFIKYGEHFMTCYNRHAMYSVKEITGNMTAPIPVLVTDDYGVRVRSYMFTEQGIAMKKKVLKDKYPNSSREISDLTPSQVLMTTINNLIPVLVINKKDTSHGIQSSNIIAWYDPDNFMFKGLVPEELKAKLLNNSPVQSATISQLKTKNDSALTSGTSQSDNGSLNIWSDFQVYPNPVCVEFNLSFNLVDNKNLKINLFDISGRLVKNLQAEALYPKGKTDFKFNISGLKTGMYILAVETSTGEIWTQRLIKQ